MPKRNPEKGLSASHVCAVAGSGVCGLAGVVVLRVTKPVIANVEVRICSPSHVVDEHFGFRVPVEVGRQEKEGGNQEERGEGVFKKKFEYLANILIPFLYFFVLFLTKQKFTYVINFIFMC